MAYNKKSLENLTKIDNTDEKINEAKSRGQIELSKKTNLLCTARTLFENANILPELVDSLKEEIQEGKTKNAIRFFDVIKEPEKQEIKTTIEGMPTTINILPVKAKDEH